MNNFKIKAGSNSYVFTKVRFFDLVSVNKDYLFTHTLGTESHNEFFKEELKERMSWTFYAVKRFKARLVGLVIAKKIIRIFLEMLMDDLVYENDRFLFPGKNIELRVGVRDNKRRKDYVYNPDTFGRDYALLMRFSDPTFKRLGSIPFYVKATRRWRERIEEHGKKFTYN